MPTVVGIWLCHVAILLGHGAMAQLDTLYFHSGEVGVCTVLQIDEEYLRFRYAGEEAERFVGRCAIDRVSMRSGRVDRMSDKVVIPVDLNERKVVVIASAQEAKGLRKKAELYSHTSFVNFRTSSSGARKARERIQAEAAAQGCEFVRFTQDSESLIQEVVILRIRIWGVTQHRCTAIGYTY
jgi:hypothetical protein